MANLSVSTSVPTPAASAASTGSPVELLEAKVTAGFTKVGGNVQKAFDIGVITLILDAVMKLFGICGNRNGVSAAVGNVKRPRLEQKLLAQRIVVDNIFGGNAWSYMTGGGSKIRDMLLTIGQESSEDEIRSVIEQAMGMGQQVPPAPTEPITNNPFA